MHVTLNIPDNLIAEVQKFSGEQPQAKALTTAMKEFIKQKKSMS